MARGAHRDGRGGRRAVTILAVILVLGAVGAGAWFLFLRPGAPIPLTEEAEVPDFSFQVGKVNGAAVGEATSEEELGDAADGVHETMDALYMAAFIDPSKWEDGTFPEVLEQFDPEAADQAEADLAYLTLAGDANYVKTVQPVVGKMDVRFLVDPEQQPTAAVAVTKFVADGELDDGNPMFVLHDGTYYLRPDDDSRWLIIGYDVSGVVQPGKRPTGGPTAGPTAGSTP